MGVAKVKFQNIRAKFGRAHKRATDEMAKAAVYFFRNTVFQNEGWEGKPWKPLAHPEPRPILQKTGKLRRSIRVMDKSTGEITIGSDVKYAGFHNSGKGKLPKRQFLGDSKILRKKLSKVISDTLKATIVNR